MAKKTLKYEASHCAFVGAAPGAFGVLAGFKQIQGSCDGGLDLWSAAAPADGLKTSCGSETGTE